MPRNYSHVDITKVTKAILDLAGSWSDMSDADFGEYLKKAKIEELLKKYCKFLPVEIKFGTKKGWQTAILFIC